MLFLIVKSLPAAMPIAALPVLVLAISVLPSIITSIPPTMPISASPLLSTIALRIALVISIILGADRATVALPL